MQLLFDSCRSYLDIIWGAEENFQSFTNLGFLSGCLLSCGKGVYVTLTWTALRHALTGVKATPGVVLF